MTQSTIDNYAKNNAKKINDFTVKNIINVLNWIVTSCLMQLNTGNEQHFITSRYKLRKRNEMASISSAENRLYVNGIINTIINVLHLWAVIVQLRCIVF